MKSLHSISVTSVQAQVLEKIKKELQIKFDVNRVVLFGSVARGEATEESDIDLLVITSRPFDRFERHKITDLAFEINLEYGTNISTIVVDLPSWETGRLSVLPIKEAIQEEGVLI